MHYIKAKDFFYIPGWRNKPINVKIILWLPLLVQEIEEGFSLILYKTLESTSLEALHEAFIAAFFDYQVKIDMPFQKFQLMLKRRGYNPATSVGAFHNEMLVGFVLNGLRNWNGKSTAYDLGTGVIPKWRRHKIISEILKREQKLYKENNINSYLLEVIKENTPALDLYRKEGFEVQREFSCFLMDKNKFLPIKTYNVEHVNKLDFIKLKEFWDFNPSWQNSIDSINSVSEAFSYSVVRIDHNVVAYGIIDKETGDIPQIAVDKRYRGRGIGRSIITDLIESTKSESIYVLNVDTKFKVCEEFLLKSGLLHRVGQYEMLLNLYKGDVNEKEIS